MIKYCIFDLDGTLLNTITTITYYVNSIFKEENITPITEEECKIFIGDGARMLIKRALNSRGIVDDETIRRVLKNYNDAYDRAPLYLTEPYPGIREVVRELSSRGVILGVVSNKPDATTVQIVKEYFKDLFSFVRGGRDGVPLKPSPVAPLEMLSLMGGDTRELAFIGDTAVDIETGKNMGAKLSIGVIWGFRDKAELINAGADVIVSSAEDLMREVLND